MADLMFATLQGYLARQWPHTTLSTLQLLSSGWESDIYVFTLIFEEDAESRDYILRLFLGEGGAAKANLEYGSLSVLQRRYPVAKALLHETDPQALGHPFIILDKIDGPSLWGVMSSAEPVREAELLDRFGQLVARLHQLDWQAFAEPGHNYHITPLKLLDEWLAKSRRFYAEFEVDGFLGVADWLEAHKKDIVVRPAIVHLDFHANNVLLDSNDRMVVIDWSQIAVADYRQDLSWTLMIMGDHGKPGWHEAILAAYERAAGYPVEHLDYFNVMSCAKLLASTVISLKVGPEALGLRPQTDDTRKKQALYLRTLSRRLQDITGLSVPEVQAALQSIGS